VALVPVISYTGPMLADLLTGSFVVENLFQIPGTGAFFINSFFSRDYTMMMGMVLFYSVLLQVLNFMSDLLLRWVDPRIRS
jgi:oligopeptide transport system permease protein